MPLLSSAETANDPQSSSRYTHSLGVKGAFDLNLPGKWTSTDPDAVNEDNFGYGGAAGVVYRVMRDRHWFLEPGLLLSYNDFGIDLQADSYVASARISKFDIIIPLTIGYQFGLFDDKRMNVMTGFEGTVCLGGSITKPTDEMSYSLFGTDGIWRRGDLKWGFGAGFVFDNVEINVMSYLGLINQLKRSDISTARVINENTVRISLTYYYQ